MMNTDLTELAVLACETQLDEYAHHRPAFKFRRPKQAQKDPALTWWILMVLGWIRWFRSLWDAKYKECPVCLAEFDNSTIAQFICGHCLCLDCAKHWYEGKLTHGDCEFKCFVPNCVHKLSHQNEVQIFDTKASLLLRYNYCKRAYSQIADEFRISCNYPDCIGVFIKVDTSTSFVMCPVCFSAGRCTHYCFLCKEFHSKKDHYKWGNQLSYTTESVLDWFGLRKKKLSEGEKVVKQLKLKTKKCPGCGIQCEKDESCNHVTCLNCGMEFNWKYEREWKGYKQEFASNTVYH
jgi:hypothetical protein